MSSQDHNDTASGRQHSLPNLTFGVEIEFVALTPIEEDTARDFVFRHLSHPVCFTCDRPGCPYGSHLSKLPINDPISRSTRKDYRLWGIDKDSSISLERLTENIAYDQERTSFETVELQSRVLQFHGKTEDPLRQIYPCTGEPFSLDAQTEIITILNVIQAAFNKPGYRCFINVSTDLHVHIGNSDSFLPLKVVKGFLKTFTALERFFDTIIPCSRNSAYNDLMPLPGLDDSGMLFDFSQTHNAKFGMDFSSYSRPMSVIMYKRMERDLFFAMREHGPSSPEVSQVVNSCNVFAWLKTIESCVDLVAIQDLWNELELRLVQKHASAINTENIHHTLEEVPKGSKNVGKETIEIRCHHGSLDRNEILAWVDLLCNVAVWSSQGDPTSFLSQTFNKPDATLLDLVKEVNASESTFNFYSDRLSPDTAHLYRDRVLSPEKNPQDEIWALTKSIAASTFVDFSPRVVESRILWKMVTGRYGQLPAKVLQHKLSSHLHAVLLTPRGKFLSLDSSFAEEWCEVAGKEFEEVAYLDRERNPFGYTSESGFPIPQLGDPGFVNPSTGPFYTAPASPVLSSISGLSEEALSRVADEIDSWWEDVTEYDDLYGVSP